MSKRREHNDYDLMKIQTRGDNLSKFVNTLAKVKLEESPKKSVYSEMIKVYINRMLKEVMLVVYDSLMYFIQKDQTQKLQFNPINFLTDVTKIIYSE